MKARAAKNKNPVRLNSSLSQTTAISWKNADNLTITPWGDLIICEDGPNEEFLIGVTPEGNLYRFARKRR